MSFPGGASGKQPTCQCRRPKRRGFDPWVGKMPEGGNGHPLQYSCLENPVDRGAQWATVMGLQRVGHDLVTFTFITDLQCCVNIYYTAK